MSYSRGAADTEYGAALFASKRRLPRSRPIERRDQPSNRFYQVTLPDEAWIDVAQDGRYARSVGSTGRSDCPGLRRSLRLELAASPFVLQLSGVSSDVIVIAISPLCLSEIKSGHIDGVGRRELASLRCTRRHGQIAWLAHPCSRKGVFGFYCSSSRNTTTNGADVARRTR